MGSLWRLPGPVEPNSPSPQIIGPGPLASHRGADVAERRPATSRSLAMADTVSDFLVRRLLAWDIHRIYGYPGDGINGVMAALERADGDPRFIQVRHEEM